MRVNRRAVVGVGGLMALSAVVPVAAKGDAKANEEFARRYIDEVWNKGNIDLLDEMVAEDFEPSEPENASGREAFKVRTSQARNYFATIIPDVIYTIESVAATEERVLFRGLIKGNATNGKAIAAAYFNELLIVDGKIKTTWGVQDNQALVAAL